MIKASETFEGTWPFLPNFFDGNGFLMHYVDEGPRQANPIILLHGEPTWGYLYRKFIPELSKSYRVVVPDMMGFGKSETPQDKEYTLKTHVENLSRLIDYLKLTNITFVGQDWGGPITAAYSIRNLNKVKGFVLINKVKCPVIGQVSMDSFITDVSFANANEGDEVTIFGKENPANVFAESAGTISYEILSSLSNRIKRIYFS